MGPPPRGHKKSQEKNLFLRKTRFFIRQWRITVENKKLKGKRKNEGEHNTT
jgi:hypothetical protein